MTDNEIIVTNHRIILLHCACLSQATVGRYWNRLSIDLLVRQASGYFGDDVQYHISIHDIRLQREVVRGICSAFLIMGYNVFYDDGQTGTKHKNHEYHY